MQGNQRQALRIAYCAGIIDGEGSICVTKTKPMQNRTNPLHAPLIRVGMNKEEPMKFLQDTFECGNIFYEGVRKDRPNQNPMFRWVVTNRDAVVKVIDMILPYLIVKREQAILIKEMCEGWVLSIAKKHGTYPEEIQRRQDYYEKCKVLNAVGAAATTKPRDTCEGEAIV
jgi:hypothetical protein